MMNPAHLTPIGSFALHLLDVGQGESIILDLPNGSFALIDAGPKAAETTVLQAIEQRVLANREFRFAALTHWDADHVGGLPGVLRAYKPMDLVVPNIDFALIRGLCDRLADKKTSDLLEEVVALSSEIRTFPMGARQSISDVGPDIQIWSLAPARSAQHRMRTALSGKHPLQITKALRQIRNDVSLVLWINAFGRTLLLPGEVDADTAGELREQFGRTAGSIHHDDPRAEWIKLGHHGSRNSTSPDFVQWFAHDWFVASASHGARYGHPHPYTLQVVREGNRGHVMCTRLGKGCHLMLQDPKKYPKESLSWADLKVLAKGPQPPEFCYGTVTVTVSNSGVGVVSGALQSRTNCPFGGPADGRLLLPTLAKQTGALATSDN